MALDSMLRAANRIVQGSACFRGTLQLLLAARYGKCGQSSQVPPTSPRHAPCSHARFSLIRWPWRSGNRWRRGASATVRSGQAVRRGWRWTHRGQAGSTGVNGIWKFRIDAGPSIGTSSTLAPGMESNAGQHAGRKRIRFRAPAGGIAHPILKERRCWHVELSAATGRRVASRGSCFDRWPMPVHGIRQPCATHAWRTDAPMERVRWQDC